MELVVIYLLMTLKLINLKQKTLKFTIHLLKCIVKDFKSSFNSAFSLCFCFDLLQNLPNFSGSIYIRHLPSVSNLGFLCCGRKFINLLWFLTSYGSRAKYLHGLETLVLLRILWSFCETLVLLCHPFVT